MNSLTKLFGRGVDLATFAWRPINRPLYRSKVNYHSLSLETLCVLSEKYVVYRWHDAMKCHS